jgi:uncharacterized secreted protein with C-terminal beta-propeller domain
MNSNQNKKNKGLIIVILLIITGVASSSLLLPSVESKFSYDVNVFQSYDELFTFYESIASKQETFAYRLNDGMFRSTDVLVPPNVFTESSMDSYKSGKESDGFNSYSPTNVQVEGVDEPDIVKTDGTYIYTISADKLYIVQVYPPSNSKIISILSFDNYSVSNMFITEEYLILLGTPHYYPIYSYEEKLIDPVIAPYYYYEQSTKIIIYNLNDINNPIEIKSIEMDGYYFDARMIGDYVYVVSIQNNYNIYLLMKDNETRVIPTITINNETYMVPPTDIYYIDSPEIIETTTHIASIDLSNMEIIQKSFLLGSSQSLYVSSKNIYLASRHYAYQPFLRTALSLVENEQMMIIHKISVDGVTISYEGKGEVPGRILNQFSMDEYDGFFRIATTTGNNWEPNQQTSNNIYVLNENLEQVGEIEEIAPGEEIYSARFIGEKAYLVTFKKIDPFFTIDLSDPYNPKIIGKLKIPGYSDYLHPFDENHIIGIGKDTVETNGEDSWRDVDFAWYQGLKIALFDVSDFENPIELSKVIIGDRGTDSHALYDHKAFLFDVEKNLLVIPVSLYEIDEDIKIQHRNYTGSMYGEFTYQGAYVCDISIENGFQLKGKISHLSDEDMQKSGFYPLYEKTITRSLYIDDFLYTISQGMIKINDLISLNQEASIDFNLLN